MISNLATTCFIRRILQIQIDDSHCRQCFLTVKTVTVIDDFLMYDLNPGGLLVVLVIRNCVNSMEVKMETARSIEEDIILFYMNIY